MAVSKILICCASEELAAVVMLAAFTMGSLSYLTLTEPGASVPTDANYAG